MGYQSLRTPTTQPPRHLPPHNKLNTASFSVVDRTRGLRQDGNAKFSVSLIE